MVVQRAVFIFSRAYGVLSWTFGHHDALNGNFSKAKCTMARHVSMPGRCAFFEYVRLLYGYALGQIAGLIHILA